MHVLHFHVLLENINENIQEDNLVLFKGLPKFEDWWISELWIKSSGILWTYINGNLLFQIYVLLMIKNVLGKLSFQTGYLLKKQLHGKGIICIWI